MNKILTVMAILVFSLSTFEQEKLNNNSQSTEIVGKVISVNPCHLIIFSCSFKVRDEEGIEHVIKASSKILEGISVGDNVYVKVDDGKAKSIVKLWKSG
ncbi:MAG TPA: hypothetical protein VH878_07990 [Thermodesulfobacteriota bacterium]|jgi:hypothetical protein